MAKDPRRNSHQTLRSPTFEDLSVFNERIADNASIETSWVLKCPAGRTSVEPGLLFAEGYESAEPDHAEAGSYSLIAAETRTGSQACA
jgi:hypothetical protein